MCVNNSMTQDVPQFIKDAMAVAAQRAAPTDWGAYFDSIRDVCPWSKSYWQKQRIDIREWQGVEHITELGEDVARIWTYTQANSLPTVEDLVNISNAQNSTRTHEEWLYSHPVDRNRSTPVPVLIQQCIHTLTEARSRTVKK